MSLFSHAGSARGFTVRDHPTPPTLVYDGLGRVRPDRVGIRGRGRSPEEGEEVLVFEQTAFGKLEWYWGGRNRQHHDRETAYGGGRREREREEQRRVLVVFIDGGDDECGAHMGQELMTWTCLVCGSVLLSQVPLKLGVCLFFSVVSSVCGPGDVISLITKQ